MKTLLIKTSCDRLINLNLEQTFVITIDNNKEGYFVVIETTFSYKCYSTFVETDLTIKEAKIIVNLIQNAIRHEKTFLDLTNLEVD